MRPLIWLTALLAALYAGYWYVGSRAVLAGATQSLTALQAEGQADFSAIRLHGFPSRFDLTIDNPSLRTADGGTRWRAPFVQILALSYRPNNVIAVLPHDQTFHLGAEALNLTSNDLRASVAVKASLDLPLDHAEVEGHQLVLTSASGWQVLAEKLIVASRQAGTDGKSHELAVVATGLAPGNDFRGQIDPARRLPAVAEKAEVDMTLDFDQPIDRHGMDRQVRIVAVRAIAMTLHWGTIQAEVSGDLAIGPDGTPEGKLALSLRNWRDALALLQDSGAMAQDQARSLENALASVAKSDDPALVSLPLSFRGGLIWLGPIPVATAPRL
jgi:hypothetical protein